MKRIFLYSFILINSILYAQDPVFFPPYQSLINLNPSFAGSNGAFRNQFFYRNQWPNLSGNNTILYNGSVDAYVKKLHGGIAVSARMNDQSHGTYRNSEINFVYAPIFVGKESGLKIIPSVQLTYLQRKIDFSRVNYEIYSRTSSWPNSHINEPRTELAKQNFDASAGLMVNYKNFYAGGTVFHLNQPDVGVYGQNRLPARISFNASYNIPLNEKTLLNFTSVFNSQSKYVSLQLAANAILMKHLVLGVGYFGNDLAFLNLGYRNNYFSVSFGYDVVVSKLAGNTRGGYQLALGLSLHKKTENTTLKSFEKW